jgi:DNA invertase Pin-like site-specific DNA recombinase
MPSLAERPLWQWGHHAGGRMLVSILASFAAFQADLISARTKATLTVVRVNGPRLDKTVPHPANVLA